jgi:hypothetical protein
MRQLSHSWRVYDDAIDDPKLMGLTVHQFRTWFKLRRLRSAHGGEVPAAAVVANKLRIAPDKAEHIVAEFAALSIDLATDGSATMRPRRQSRSDLPTPRVRRSRKRRRAASSTGSERSPDAETQTAQAPTPSPGDRAPNAGNIDYDPIERDDQLFQTESEVLNFADPDVRVRRVRVTNGLDVLFTDRFDGVLVTIAPGESESITLDMAAHFFGPAFDPPAMFRHVSKRQGWNTPEYLKTNPATGKTLAEENFAKLKITPVLYKMVEEESDPDQRI